ncbi:MAG: ABC transporter permease, partial [Bacteroidetes bacterium]|nr:ABC transporter permease [Bacteroidota bacterium]
MLLSYIKIALRNLRRNKLISFINIFGLGLSMSIGLMELVRIQDALSYDKFHPYPDRTWRIISEYRQSDGQHWKLASTPAPLRDALKTDTADIQQIVAINTSLRGPATAAGTELNLNAAFTEPSFFRIFGFTLTAGDPQTALDNPGSIVLTAATARRFFGAADPMGKFISFGKKGQYIVTGILATPPTKSHIDFDAYASGSSIPSNDWGDCRAAYTYVLTKNTGSLKGRLRTIAATVNKTDKQGVLSFDIQPLSKITPGSSDIYNDIGRGGAWSKLWIEIDVTLLLLIAACFNYTNLTVSRALTRAKEVGVRKINGARRYQIFMQYIVEACVTAFLALGFAWLLFSLIVRYAPFNDGYEMVPSSFHYDIPYVLTTLGFAFFTGLLAGSAPAWMLSSFRPLRVLKNLTTARLFGSIGLQKTLIVFQYSLSLILIIFLSAFYRQFALLSSKDRGFKKDNVLVVHLNGADKDRVATALAATSGVSSVSGLSVAFQPRYEGARGPGWIDKNQKGQINFNYFFADRAFIPAMKIDLLAGTNFTSDDSTERSVIINSKASKLL